MLVEVVAEIGGHEKQWKSDDMKGRKLMHMRIGSMEPRKVKIENGRFANKQAPDSSKPELKQQSAYNKRTRKNEK